MPQEGQQGRRPIEAADHHEQQQARHEEGGERRPGEQIELHPEQRSIRP
jgi:hypothetical protein